jgi:hypothetical protein
MNTPESSYQPDPVKRVEGTEQPLGSLIPDLSKLTAEQAINTLKIIKAKTEADAADYQRRLVMQQFRPCKMYPVIIYHDGMRWVCSYGVMGEAYREYLPDSALGQTGVEAYGEYPEEAMQNFDAMWVGSMVEDIASAVDDEDEDDEDEL